MPSAVIDQIPNSDDESYYSDDDDGNIIDGIRIPPATKPTCSFDPTGPRLIITKISNSFFKSYANETILGPFHKCFNAIVGPNGSGKSNVIDSMLFVFGYRATKIRSKKISVLIHNSGKFRNVQSCTVTVHFAQIIDKEGDEYDIIPGSEFSVSRTANKDNSSFYTLNNKRVHFKEVAVVLKGHGIDLDHNRFLILQGEVEQISMMKPKAENENECGMLEYLEDIIGTTRYKKPLVQVFERLEYLAERRTEKINRLQIVEKEMDQWKQPMEEAVGFLKTENTVVISRNFLYQYQIYSIKKQIVEIEQEQQTILDVQKDFEEKLNKIASEQKEKEKLLKQKLAGYEHLNQRKEQLTEAYNNANNQDITLQETFTDLNTKRKKTKELIISEGKRIEKLKKVPEESERVIADCEQKIQKLSVEKEKLEEEKNKLFQSIRKETEPLHAKKDVLQNELIGLNETTVATKSEFTVAETELKTCLSKEESEKAKFDAMTEKYHSTQSTIEERTKELSTLKNKIPPTEKSLNSALQELNATKQEEVNVVKRIKSNRDNLEEKKNSMQASSSRGRIVNALMKQKRDGNCPGLYGRLGDLGGIDLKYDIAISTACGSLDCIVVDTVDTAQWCIEHLKQYNLGRATFISLDKQEHLRELANSKIRTPENVPRLYDLIRVQDETVKTAFYYSLRNTLVADDIEQATRIAYGQERFRVVTLNGNIIETSGTMSGGGKQVSRGRMGQSVRVSNVNPKELESLEEDITEMEQQLREIKQKEVTLENQINVLQPELTKMKANFEKFRRELEGLKQQQPVLERQLKEQEAKTKATKADPAQVKKLTKIVEVKKQEYEAAAKKSESIQKQIDKISEEIAAKSSGQMKVVEKKLKEAISGIAKAQKEITRLQVAVTIAERDGKKAEENLNTMKQDVIDYETKLKEIMAQRTEIEEDATKLLKCLEEISTQLAEAEESHGDMKKEVQALVKKENDLKSEKIDIDQNVKQLKAKLNDYNGAIHQQEVLISRLKLHEIPNESAIELKKYSDEELEQEDSGDYQKELEAAEKLLKAAKPNLSAIDAYKKQQAAYLERSKELEEIVARRQQMRKVYDDLKLRRREEFISGYNIIRMKLKEMYQMITLGGDADFEMVDTYDPFSEGIQLNVRPPKKSWKKISNLSGGEKTLSSLALVFALHYYKPSPLYVMDEIDAALDFKNVSIVGNYIQSRTKNAQFIIISLRSNMFELCDNLVGIYKVYDCTQTACIDPRVYDEVIPRASQQSRNPADGDANTVEQTQNKSVETANTSQQSIETNQQENNKTDGETNQQENNEKDIETNQQQINETDIETNQQENNQTNMDID